MEDVETDWMGGDKEEEISFKKNDQAVEDIDGDDSDRNGTHDGSPTTERTWNNDWDVESEETDLDQAERKV